MLKIGEYNVLDILNKVETLSTEREYGYSEQKAIGEKPTLTYTGEGLRRYSLPIKLHFDYCNPDNVIKGLNEKAAEREIFSYFQRNNYVGEFVISKIAENIIEQYDGTTLYAEIIVDLIEAADEKEEYKQQTKTVKNPVRNLKSVDITPYIEPVKVLSSADKEFFENLTDDALDKALRQTDSYITSNINEAINNVI